MLSLPQRRTLPKRLLHIHIQTLQARKRILPLLNISTYNPQRAIHTRTPLVPNHPRPRRHPDDGCLSWKPMRQNNHRRKLVLLPMIHYCHATMKLDLKTHSGNTRQHTSTHVNTHVSQKANGRTRHGNPKRTTHNSSRPSSYVYDGSNVARANGNACMWWKGTRERREGMVRARALICEGRHTQDNLPTGGRPRTTPPGPGPPFGTDTPPTAPRIPHDRPPLPRETSRPW